MKSFIRLWWNPLMTSPNSSQFIGITSTVPLEVIFAAGLTPVDINNIFIESEDPESLVTDAESAGFSSNICAWIKGIYSTVISYNIGRVVAVTGGDCSNTIALAEIMGLRGYSGFLYIFLFLGFLAEASAPVKKSHSNPRPTAGSLIISRVQLFHDQIEDRRSISGAHF